MAVSDRTGSSPRAPAKVEVDAVLEVVGEAVLEVAVEAAG